MFMLPPYRENPDSIFASWDLAGVPAALTDFGSASRPAAQAQDYQEEEWKRPHKQWPKGQTTPKGFTISANQYKGSSSSGACGRAQRPGHGEPEVAGSAGGPSGWGEEAGAVPGQQEAALHLKQRGSVKRNPVFIETDFS